MVRRRSPSLGELERVVMQVLWGSADAVSVREVHEAVGDQRDLAYTTVLTVLDRLARKDLVTRERDGRAWRYRPAVTREELTATSMRDTFEELVDSDRRAAMLHFLDDASPGELADLRAALDEVERRHES